MRALARAGEIVSTDMVLAGVQELLVEAENSPWLLDENQGSIDYWLELLPFGAIAPARFSRS